MEVFAITKNVRMSAQKMREVVRQIQGLPAIKAKAILEVVPRKGARVVAKTLDAALGNAAFIEANWKEEELQQKITELERQHENTRDHKKRNKFMNDIKRFRSFLDSANRLDADKLWVKEAFAQTASTYKRFTPKARGSAGPILKRNCHVKITLSDE